ncbi:MAG: hypothetical protein IJS82_06350 [Paludibacteraceae bacterium]|nr:hypothetical protein [Paludibacteraceae bacterium]
MTYSIHQVNWPESYPYCPQTMVEVTNDHERLFLTFRVKGEQLRAVAMQDQEAVWEDSCVEFFCQVPGEEEYMNFEVNCIGTMVAARRKGRAEDVRPLPADEMASIERHCTYPHQRIEERDGMFEWQVELSIPLRLIFGEDTPVFPKTLRVNFYKCADQTKKPHYVSWQPIQLPTPNFHCPEFFGEIVLR